MTEEKETDQTSVNPFEQEAEEGSAKQEVPVSDGKKETVSNRETFLNFLKENKERSKESKK